MSESSFKKELEASKRRTEQARKSKKESLALLAEVDKMFSDFSKPRWVEVDL